MSKETKDESNWLDDAFDDKKAAQDLEEALKHNTSRTVALVLLILVVVAFFGIVFLGIGLLENLTSLR